MALKYAFRNLAIVKYLILQAIIPAKAFSPDRFKLFVIKAIGLCFAQRSVRANE